MRQSTGTYRASPKKETIVASLLLLITLSVGAYFRFTGTNWDDYVNFHPDERFLTGSVGSQLGRGWLTFTDGTDLELSAYCADQYPETRGVGPFFDARCSDMNPHNIGAGHFAYGTLPVFTAWSVGRVLDQTPALTGGVTGWAVGVEHPPILWS